MFDTKMTEELRKTLLDITQFKKLCEFFIFKSLETKIEENPEIMTHFAELVRVIALGTADTIHEVSESPIEKIFLNALLLDTIRNDALCIELFHTNADIEKEIEIFRDYLTDFKYFMVWSEKQGFNTEERNNYLDEELKKERMSEMERIKITDMTTKYHYLNMDDKFHMCLQPKLYGYIENKKFIRPDILFFIPNKPKVKIIVECDGFQYHGQKSNFISDRKRDRVLQKNGFQVLRYSGTEIFEKPSVVAHDLLEYLWEHE